MGSTDNEPSISEILAGLGVSHVRDDHSTRDGKHTLFFAGRCIGRFDAHEVGDLIREHLAA
jgi:hypothetical protein